MTEARWREAIDATYRGDIEIVIDEADADALLMLGKDGALILGGSSGERRLVGMVTEVEHLEPLLPTQTRALVRLEPAAAVLDLSQRSRIFQHQTVPEILDRVLGAALRAYGREHELTLVGNYPVREYCVQYRESDLAFVQRIAAEEGISYAFDHEGQVERMILRDRNAFPSLPQQVLRFDARTDATEEGAFVFELERVSVPTATKVSVGEHDWTSPAEPKRGSSGDESREIYEWGLGRSLTFSDYGGKRYGSHDADRQAALRLEAFCRDGIVLDGKSRVLQMAEGTTFTLDGHSVELDDEYLVVEVEHRVAIERGREGRASYTNQLRCIPNAVSYRPLRKRPKPRVPSVQTAVVTGPAGEEIHTDEHGRVKVQLHWDLEGRRDETSSCWLRVKQAWAGGSWGIEFVPRIGMEVLVYFLHGDPDHPIVGGCLYNSDRPVPYALPDHKTRSTIKSQSSPGGNGYNELRFEDLAGEEQVFLHAQNSLDEAILADHTTNVGGNQTNTVHGSQTQVIDANQRETVDGDQKMTVDGNRQVVVGGPFKEKIVGGEEKHVAGAETEKIVSGGEIRMIVGGLRETYGSDEKHHVSAGQTETIVAGHGFRIGGTHDETITGSLSQRVGANYELDSTGGVWNANVGATFMTFGDTGNITATNMSLVCDTRLEIDPYTFKHGATESSAITNKFTQASAVVDMSGMVVDQTLIKLELVASVVEIFSSKYGLYGFKADVVMMAHALGGSNTTFTALLVVVP